MSYSFDDNFARAQRDYDNQTDDHFFGQDAEAVELDGLEEDMAFEDFELETEESEPDWDSMNENW